MIKKITYKNQEIPVSMGYYALTKVKEETGEEFTKISPDQARQFEAFIWYSIEAGCKFEDMENPIKRDDVLLLIDQSYQDILSLIPVFTQALLPEDGPEVNQE